MRVHYVHWSDIRSLKLQPRAIHSIYCHEELEKSGRLLLDDYLNGQIDVAPSLDHLQKMIKRISSGTGMRIDILTHPDINEQLVQTEWIIEEEVKDEPDYVEAQLITNVYLLSTLLSFLFLSRDEDCIYLDPRDVILTDETWTESEIIKFDEEILQELREENLPIITTHGIGITSSNESTLTSELKYWERINDYSQ